MVNVSENCYNRLPAPKRRDKRQARHPSGAWTLCWMPLRSNSRRGRQCHRILSTCPAGQPML